VLRDLAGRAADYGLSRRAFLGLLGAAGGSAALSACGTSGPDSIRVSGGKKGVLRWASWPDYIDVSDKDASDHPTIDEFEKKTGINVLYYDKITDSDVFYGTVRGELANAQDIGYDLTVQSSRMVGTWIELGYAHELDRTKMPNTKNLIKSLDDPNLTSKGTYSMPWQGGFTVLAWNKSKVEKMTSVSELWSNKDLHGKVEVFTEFSYALPLIMWEQGVDPSSNWGDDEFNNALDVIKTNVSNGQIRKVAGNDYLDDLDHGDAWAVIGWSGDISQLNVEAGEEKYGICVPDAGGQVWSDSMVAPYTSNQMDSVEKLINFYYDPAVAAQVSATVGYICPVEGTQAAIEKINPDLAKNEWIFPTDDLLKKTSFLRWVSTADYQKYTNEFLDATSQ